MHLNEISSVQLILIEIGAVLQIVALCAFIRESAKPARVVPGAQEAQVAHEEEARCKLPEAPLPAQVVQHHRELHGVTDHSSNDLRPGNLVKTAKVSFKQTFKARP